MGAKEQSGRTWPSIFWARGTTTEYCKHCAKLFLQLSELGLPQPLTRTAVLGEGHTRWRERAWESPNSDEGAYTVVLFINTYFVPETHIMRQRTRHECLPSLLCVGFKGTEIVYGEEKKYFALGRLEQPRQDKNLLCRHNEPNEPRAPSYCMYSTVNLVPHLPQFQQTAGATPL